jgi:hypothetical protein
MLALCGNDKLLPISTKRKVLAVAKKSGVIIDDNGYSIFADCPDGFVLKDFPGLHYVKAEYGSDCFTKGQCWGMILSDIKNGIEKCDCDDCKLLETPTNHKGANDAKD